MPNPLPPIILLDIAIFFTALSWGIGLSIVGKKLYLITPFAIGCLVCLTGYSVQSLGAPGWAVMLAPVVLDIVFLWYIFRQPRKMATAYIFIWVIYTLFHILLSVLFHYDSLIPVWKLHS
jgi:hypothetical protein